MKTHYRTNLPHIQPIGEVFFVTFRLADSLPINVVQKLKDDYAEAQKEIYASRQPSLQQLNDARKRYFNSFDSHLDKGNHGNHWLKQPEIAKIVSQKLHEFDKVYYDLYAYMIMSNHVHLLVDFGKQIDDLPMELLLEEIAMNENKLATFDIHYKPLYKVLNLIKGASSRYANLELGRSGTFWQRDNYDYYVRNGRELENIFAYIANNPVKAGLIESWEDFPFTYLVNR